MAKNYILTEEVIKRKLERLAYEILENNVGEENLILVGIRESGSVIAMNIEKILHEISTIKTECLTATLDKKFPKEVTFSKNISFDDKVIIIIDDVSNSGKTLLYALKPFLDFHPKKIQALVLVERTHKAFPVKPDYVGLSIATTLQEHIYVESGNGVVKGAWLE
ncbi:MAG: phosphoribosyltransferase [Bacteroidetes bacterium]|nr:phosphoribosyltransferase [Bacteroidota bacterium]